MKSSNCKWFLLLLILVLNRAAFSQSNWNLLPSLSGNLKDIHFINNLTGWVVGSNIYKTTNGGLNWTLQLAEFANAVCFINENTGFIGGNSSKRTTDGGINWTDIAGLVNIADITFPESQIGYAAGSNGAYGTIFKTTNTGLNWSVYQIPQTNTQLLAAHFINKDTGWFSGISGNIRKTTNGGSGWVGNMYSSYGALYDIFFVDAITGWITNYSNVIRRSTDGGASWNQQSLPTFCGYALHFSNANDGRVVGPVGIILRTVNGGTNWFNETSPTTETLNGIFFTGNDTGYICGNNGTLLKTVNGGNITNIQNVSSEIPERYSLSQNFPNPFNPSTVIKFDIPVTAFVQLKIYDIQGKEISILINEQLNAGTYSVDFDGSKLSSGVYNYRISAGSYSETKRMILVK